MKAAVVHDIDKLVIEEVELDPPSRNEVKIRMAATGVCHSDLSVINGTIPADLPFILGHEGAGVVDEIGEGVQNVNPGDHVVLSFVPHCRECFFCMRGQGFLCEKAATLFMGLQLDGTSRVHSNGTDFGVMNGLGCMAPYAVVPSISVVPIDPSISLQAAALVGCAVTTGVGAALNTARVEPGSSVAVLGCGGVGLSVIQGARISGAERIVAIDLSSDKAEMAKKFGATHSVTADENTVKGIKKLTGGRGVDYAFEAIGIPKVMELAYTLTRNGGKTIMVGIGKQTERVGFNALTLPIKGKTICGCMYGSANTPVDFPRMLGLYQAKKLDLDGMISQTYSIDEAPKAFADLEKGENARGIIVYE
jgi:S-(hydroxymethyl)glutathione dehydrogenase/alcohol dehydrogenase